MVQLYLIAPDPSELGRAIAAFLRAKRARRAPTVAAYHYALARFSRCASWPPTSGACQAFVETMQADGLSEASQASYWRSVRVFLRWCVATRRLASDPAAGLDHPRDPDPEPRAVPQHQLRKLFAHVGTAGDPLGPRDAALFRLVYDCGLRASEACGLRVADLGIDRQAVIVQGKGGKWRECYFGSRCATALAAWLAIHPASPWLFPNVRGRQLTRTGVRLALRRRCTQAGVALFRVHDLRHSYVVHMLRRGVNPRIVSDQVGHASVAFTLYRYGREADEERRLMHLAHAPGDDV
jgi:integrase/recombinase XerD